ncbi:MAG TPA: sigma-70 family RNA polymerase sigma factor [Ktedonobacterales bacterium]|nr:sigma-70 family RNA polymerase sigma factor [Ktedonobacterales bacterium]
MGEREGSRAGRVANWGARANETPETPGTPATAGAVEGAAELALIQRAATGDHHAFAVLVRHYEPRLVAYLTPMLGDPEAARDVAQETFLAAFRALPRWRPPETFPGIPADAAANTTTPGTHATSGGATHPLSPWLYRIATNQALSLLRARPTAQARAPDGDPPDRARLVGGATSSMSFEDRYAARELLQLALRRLSAADAACLVLHFVAGERYAEIGARLGMSAEAVRKRVARGLTALRAAYATLDVEAPR